MLASVVNQVPHCGFPVASLVGFIGTCGLFVAGFPCRATGLRGRTAGHGGAPRDPHPTSQLAEAGG